MPRYDDGTVFTSIIKPTIVLVGTSAEYGEISIDDLRIVIAETLSLEELQDVVITTIQDKQVLQWDTATSKWVNANFNLDGLTDVVLTSVAQGDVFVYNGTNWINLAKGTTNQLLGMNNGATEQEYKTFGGTTNQVTVTHSAGGITLSLPQNIATTSSPTFASLSLTSALTAPNGGTGQSSYTIGDILYASTGSALSKLSGIATGNALISGGVGTAPSWGKVGLSTHISGTLGVGNGGLGITTTPSNGFLPIGNGTNYVAAAITGTVNQVTVTNASGSITLSLPQSIAASSTPTFAGISLTANSFITGNFTFNSTGNTRYILTSESGTGTGKLVVQAGAGSDAFGGAINLYAHAHATKPGDVVVALSSGSSGKFRVNSTALDGGNDMLQLSRTTGNLILQNGGVFTDNGARLQVTGTAAITSALSIGNTVAASVATPSTHKVTMVIGGVTYYLLATNV